MTSNRSLRKKYSIFYYVCCIIIQNVFFHHFLQNQHVLKQGGSSGVSSFGKLYVIIEKMLYTCIDTTTLQKYISNNKILRPFFKYMYMYLKMRLRVLCSYILFSNIYLTTFVVVGYLEHVVSQKYQPSFRK